MRITNKMMTNNALYNINNNKKTLSSLEQQYSTGKKIQRPSEDPIIAVRALKLRTNLTEITQFVDKNIPDAMSWMNVTESALDNVNNILSQMNTYCVQGSNDTLTEQDRKSIVANLKELKNQIYQEGNAQYAGRYVFTGYKTDTSLVFQNDSSDTRYKITENLNGSDIDIIKKSINSYELSDYDSTNPTATDFSAKPNVVTAYRLQLAYNSLDTEEEGGTINIEVPTLDANGEYITDDEGNVVYEAFPGTIDMMDSTNEDAYQPLAGEIHYLADTGELIIGSDVYDEYRSLSDIKVTYEKTNFSEGDLRPEHYFDCTATNVNDPDAETIEYTKSQQDISYEVNFNQTLKINTEGSDSLTHGVARCIDDILNAVNDVTAVESKITEVKSMLEDENLSDDQKSALNGMLEVLNTEYTLKSEIMQTAFENGITELNSQQDIVSVAVADLGSRYVRLQLTESRLSDEQTDFTDLLSTNEDADVVETYIKLTSQETIYNSSLSAAAKLVKNSLLDFL